MAFPWLFSDGLESGTTVATASSGTLIDFPHYTELARQGMAPYRGSYAMRVRLAGGTTSQFVREDTGYDTSAAGTFFHRMYFYLGKDLVMADTDKFSLFEAESVLNTTTEVAFGIIRSGANINLWYAETAAATAQTFTLGSTTTALGKWYHIEIKALVDSGVGNDGTLDAWLDDAPGTQITALDQGAIVDAKIGVIGPDAGTSGTILIDDIIADDARIFMDRDRFRQPNSQQTFATDHPMVGPGKFSVWLTGTGTNAVLSIYDSDGVPSRLEPITIIRNLTANEGVPSHDILEVKKGAYCVLSGTAAQAFYSIDCGGIYSDGTYVAVGQRNGAPRT